MYYYKVFLEISELRKSNEKKKEKLLFYKNKMKNT